MTKRKARSTLPATAVSAPVPATIKQDHRPEVLKAELRDGGLKLTSVPGQHAALKAAFGSDSWPFQNYAFTQVLNIMRVAQDGDDLTADVNALFAMIAGIAPQSELEAMLAAQMVATHHLAMRQLSGLTHSEEIAHHEMYGNLGNKLLRTFTMQMEALAKLRRGGEQIVKYVHVHEGGQAVVAGTINQHPRGEKKTGE